MKFYTKYDTIIFKKNFLHLYAKINFIVKSLSVIFFKMFMLTRDMIF